MKSQEGNKKRGKVLPKKKVIKIKNSNNREGSPASGGINQGITFDDVLLVPQKSAITPDKVETKTRFSRNIELNIPLTSSPMDTVTESRLAIAIALEGGLGIVHKNLGAKEQAAEIAEVKRFRNGFIENPLTLRPDDLIKKVVKIRMDKGYKNVPIVDKRGQLVGLITKFDYFWPEDEKMPIKKLMKPLKELATAPLTTDLKKAQEIIKKKKLPVLLIIDKQGRLKSLVTRSDLEKSRQFPLATKDSRDRLRVGGAIGVGPDSLKRAELLAEAGVDVIIIDTAHGHSQNVINTLKELKKNSRFKGIDIVAGNIATAQAAQELIEAGADGVKVGIGPGSICTTRIIAGVGVPQITAIQNAVAGRGKANIPIIADGGIKYSGDIVKALAAGADSVMIGQLFAATEESPGDITYMNGRMYKVYRGMGSVEAMTQGSKDRYGQATITDSKKLVPEGIVGQTIYRGKLADHLYQLVGGLKSGMGYVGARTIAELQKKAEFIQITENSLKESHPHDITITKEAPNYQRID